MESPSRQIILNCEKLERRMALLKNGRLEEYQIEREDNEPKVGNIYLGRIINLESSLQAAFVDIGAEKNAFLHYHDMLPGSNGGAHDDDDDGEAHNVPAENINARRRRRNAAGSKGGAEEQRRKKKLTIADIPGHFRPGMEILVQVVKGPISTKGARVTTDISIPGRYLVLMPYCDHIGLSSRIEGNAERDRLRKILASLELPDGMGLICRTVGEGRKAAFFRNDLDLLLDYWHKIEKRMESSSAPCQLFAEPNLIERTVRDFVTDDIDGIVVDSPEANTFICDTLKRIGGRKMAGRVTFYNSPKPIFDAYRINEQLKDVYCREVKLPGGGGLYIDETEALIAIDVNSGKGRKGADQPEFILKTNLEAAEEIARQLRLRNIGGLVVLDFIDMRSARDRDEVFRHMKKMVKDDRAKTKVIPISRLGLMEMTRQREHESIKDQIYTRCPYCSGSGHVKSEMSMSVEIQRQLNALLRSGRAKKIGAVRVIMHPEVLARMKNEDAALLTEIEKRYHYELSFRSDESLHYEEFKLVDPDSGESLI